MQMASILLIYSISVKLSPAGQSWAAVQLYLPGEAIPITNWLLELTRC